MSLERKARGDAVLKTLSVKRQAEIVEHALGHTLAETVAWLKEKGITTSCGALSQWLSWYQLRQRIDRNRTVVETLIETLRHEEPGLTQDQLFRMGQSLFSGMAIESADPKVWIGTQRLGLQAQQLELGREEARLQREKFEFDAARACLENLPALRAIAANGQLDSNGRIEAVRRKLFGSVPETTEAGR